MNFGDERDEIWRRMSWLSPLSIRFTHAEISAAAWLEKLCHDCAMILHFVSLWFCGPN